MTDLLRVLLVEDSPDDALLIVRELSRGGFDVTWERVASAGAMQAALKSHAWDFIISDFTMPGFGGAAALALYQKLEFDIPFIVVSGLAGESWAVEMLKAGAHNYVMKDQLGRLVPAVREELLAAKERLDAKQAKTTAAYISSIVQSCDHAIVGTTLDGTVVSWNNGAARLFGYTAAEIIGHPGAVLLPAYRPENLSEILRRIAAGGCVESCETALLRKDGRPVHVLLAVSPVKEANGRVIGASLVAHDITRRKLEESERLALIQELTAALTHANSVRVQASGNR